MIFIGKNILASMISKTSHLQMIIKMAKKKTEKDFQTSNSNKSEANFNVSMARYFDCYDRPLLTVLLTAV